MDVTRIEEKIDKIAEDIVDIKVTMARNTASLDEHIRRTELAELNIHDIKEELEPIKKHVYFVQDIGTLLYNIAKVLAAIATVLGVLHAFKIV